MDSFDYLQIEDYLALQGGYDYTAEDLLPD